MTERLHREVHDGSGPFLLLVHGFLSGRAQWRPNLAALSRVARPVVVELWGHGRSPAPVDATRHRSEAYVEAFEEIRRELGVERWLVCGQSLGAALTLRYALDHPQRFLAHVITNSVSALADAAWSERWQSEGAAFADAALAGGREGLERMPIHPLRARRIAADDHRVLLEDAALLDPVAVAQAFRHLIPNVSMRPRLGENRVPTLLVCGEREASFAECRAYAEQHMPELEVALLDAGHAVNLEAADGFNRAVCAFLSRHVDGARGQT